jgi:hypothetical protein
MEPFRFHYGTYMPNLTIKNVPDELYEALRLSAETSRRSLNSQAIVLLEGALKRHRTVEETLARIRELRKAQGNVPPLTNAEINKAKRQGRP